MDVAVEVKGAAAKVEDPTPPPPRAGA